MTGRPRGATVASCRRTPSPAVPRSAPTSRACAPSRSSPSCSAHAGVGLAEGGFAGVDVFFVISGFLITGSSSASSTARDRSRSRASSRGRIKRLMPQVLAVVAAVVVASSLLLAPPRADAVASDVMATGVYAMNWRLSESAVDYFAAGDADRPLDHFWSLAVEEQFYIVWPLLLLAVGCAAPPPRAGAARPARRAARPRRGRLVRPRRPAHRGGAGAGVLLGGDARLGARGRRAARARAAGAPARRPPRARRRVGRGPRRSSIATRSLGAGSAMPGAPRCCPCSARWRCSPPGRAPRRRCRRAR